MEGTHIHGDKQLLETAWRHLGQALGEDCCEALENTADRFARWQINALVEPRKAYDPERVKLYPVPENSAVGLITVKVTAYSACEHHYAPAWLKATIGYEPDQHFVGYSKIVKMFKHFACRYTMDERICDQFIQEFVDKVKPKGVGVYLRGKHFCVISRGGVEDDFPMMNALWGSLRTDEQLRREFFGHATTSWKDGI